MEILFSLRVFDRNNYFFVLFYWKCRTWDLNPGLTSNIQHIVLLDYSFTDFKKSFGFIFTLNKNAIPFHIKQLFYVI